MNAVAYVLWHGSAHLVGSEDDAILVPFKDNEYVCGWLGTETLQVPDPVLFEANFKVTQHSDYPCNDVNWPLMSPRMLELLCCVGDFSYQLIPVRLVDRRVSGSARYLPDGSLRPEVIDDRFAAVQLTEHIDVVDWEHSTFRRRRTNPNSVFFDRLVLLEPAGGFPPLFRVPAQKSLLLVSAKARGALEAAGIRGVVFDELPDRVSHGSV